MSIYSKSGRLGVKTRSCKCGRCKACIEVARWERIYNEKFADPDYYNRPVSLTLKSSLGKPVTTAKPAKPDSPNLL